MAAFPRLAGLTTRLLAVCLGLYLLTTTVATLFEVVQVADQASQSSQTEIASLAKTFSPPLDAALWSYDFTQVEILLKVLAEIPSVGRVQLFTTEGTLYEGKTGQEQETGPLGAPLVTPLTHERNGRFVFVGTLKIQSSLSAVQQQVAGTIGRAVARSALVLVLLSIVLILAARRIVGRPLRNLATQIQSMDPRAASLATLSVDKGAGSELTLVAEAFNRLLAELFALNASLESKVASRTLHLEQTIQELSSTRDKLVDSAKMAVLGQLVAGVAHDLNTPLGAALSASSSALELLEGLKKDLASPLEEALFQRSATSVLSTGGGRQESKLRRQMTAEMKSAGLDPDDEMVDALVEMGIEPPLGNLIPLLAAPDGRPLLERAHRYSTLARSCRVMSLASEKMAGVVDNLLRYSRKEAEDTPQPSDLQAQLETILVLFAAAVKGGVSVVRRFESVPPVLCRGDRLQQVWINLVGNAIQAMNGKGILELATRKLDGAVEVTVANNGPPIPPETAQKLFTPFFTTKPRGSGTGLGLSICQRIVEEHGGRIEFESTPERTAFKVRLPVRPLSSPSAS